MDEDSWASSPSTDLLLEIFRRLNASDVVRCACACKTWRRAIIANASSLHPIPDRFVPDLLLGFFHEYWYKDEKKGMRIQPSSRQPSTPTARDDAATTTRRRALSYRPARPAAASTWRCTPGWCRLGTGTSLLLDGDDVDDLCLCNPMTGSCTFVPRVAFPAETYVLVTG
jgi:hypothetical protein